ncbi:NAD(P)H-dependent oxidoreductase [Demequina sp. NBRC 110051]|uniref:NAD(P)H-dependent oxidoreductase n=1 Tax=Demequina sp. NBRC 110051 TaxID=1570340 RepID=UPI000A055960|nr:NAD(P)H-dependent oxidoreductase [Demequina sp. NBRC 110051]
MTRIAVIVGHPIAGSLNHALAASYIDAARAAGAEVRVIDLAEPSEATAHPTERSQLRHPDVGGKELDAATAQAIDTIDWTEHLVFVYPEWWGSAPAVLKGFIDRVFLSGFAFRYRGDGRGWDKLLTGRTARILHTMDSPRWWNRWVYRDSSLWWLRRATLWYTGVRTIGTSVFTPVRGSSAAARERWIAKASALGTADAARTSRVIGTSGAGRQSDVVSSR